MNGDQPDSTGPLSDPPLSHSAPSKPEPPRLDQAFDMDRGAQWGSRTPTATLQSQPVDKTFNLSPVESSWGGDLGERVPQMTNPPGDRELHHPLSLIHI